VVRGDIDRAGSAYRRNPDDLALLGAARMIEAIDAIAKRHAPLAVGTVGLIEVKPNSRNVIPAEVFFTIDFRHPDSAVLDAVEAEIRAAFEDMMTTLNLAGEWKRIWDQPPVAFDAACVAAVRKAAATCGFSVRDIVSGAGHDAAYIARVARTAMVFVPCKDGISHNEAEFTSKEQCAAGAQVLLNAVLDFDRQLAARSE
jgi:N-carbamoyl-L-amino-acid hydrolase